MWTLAASSLAGAQLAEIDNASNREIAQLLGRTNTVQFQVPSSSALTPYLASTDILIDAYDGADHRFRGRVISYNRVAAAEGRSMSVVAADPSWVFSSRLVGKSQRGYESGGALDRGLIVKTLIDAANAERSTRVRTSVLPYLAGSTSTYNSGPFKPLSTAIGELSGGIYGFDWSILPVKGVDNVWGDWFAAPVIGTYNADMVFSYVEGGGGNMKSITDSVTKIGQANRAYHALDFGTPTPQSAIVASDLDAASLESIRSDDLYETVVSAQLWDDTLRQRLVDENVALRRYPRRVITFEPQDYDPSSPGGVPRFGVDYDLGDVVRARAEDEHGLWFDGLFRVYGWTAKPSNEGLESGTLMLIDDGSVGSPGVS